MLQRIENLIYVARGARSAHIFIYVLRILLGFAFIPAGLKKVLGQPFTDPTNTGTFHEFLHAFHDTGLFYRFVGSVQLLAAVLLMTQYYGALGAVIITPIIAVIFVFCWSTLVIPTATVVTFMLMGVSILLAWDIAKWRRLISSKDSAPPALTSAEAKADPKLWSRCGWLILILYFGHTVITGEVYRPKGVDWSNPSFILLQIIALLPIVTFFLDSRRSLNS